MSKVRKARKWILCTVYAHEDGKRFFWDNCVEFGDELEKCKAKAAEDDLEIVEEVELAVKGKTYAERKQNAIATIEKAFSTIQEGMDFGSESLLYEFMDRIAKSFGLVGYFREKWDDDFQVEWEKRA